MSTPAITIDDEFKFLLPPLDPESYSALEENLLQHGVRDALVLWDGILIDGHNRYEIATRHGLPFQVVEKDFDSREEVTIWMVSTQIARRNLSPMQLSYFRGRHYRADKYLHGGHNKISDDKASGQNDHLLGSTAKRLAERYRVSPKTIRRDAAVANGIDAIGASSAAAKQKIIAGEVSISRTKLQEVSRAPKREVSGVARSIDRGTFERPRPGSSVSAGEAGSGGVGSSGAGAASLGSQVLDVTDDFRREIRGLASSVDDSASVRAALRTHIERLEELYRT